MRSIGAFFICFFMLSLLPVTGQCSDEVVVLYTGDTLGHVEPCG